MSAQIASDLDLFDTRWKQVGASDGMVMTHSIPARSASRIKWFSQLTAALDEAQCLLAQLRLHGGNPGEAERMRTEVLALSCEIELLRSEGFIAQRSVVSDLAPPCWQWDRP